MKRGTPSLVSSRTVRLAATVMVDLRLSVPVSVHLIIIIVAGSTPSPRRILAASRKGCLEVQISRPPTLAINSPGLVAGLTSILIKRVSC
jgi:hypothetical protein